jgi:hypothetical protein
MTLLQILPILVYAATIVTIFAATASDGTRARPGLWRLPAVVGGALCRVSAWSPIAQEGLVQFWAEPYHDLGRQSGLVRPSVRRGDRVRPDAAARPRRGHATMAMGARRGGDGLHRASANAGPIALARGTPAPGRMRTGGPFLPKTAPLLCRNRRNGPLAHVLVADFPRSVPSFSLRTINRLSAFT